MGVKSNYFRHSFEAHNDEKMLALMDNAGLKGIGFFWILVEIYGRALNDSDSEESVVNLHRRRIATATGLRSDSVQTHLRLLSELQLIDPLRSKFDSTKIQLSIPNFLKYFGKYKKTKQFKPPKEKKSKIKENKEEEKEIKIEKKDSISDDPLHDFYNLFDSYLENLTQVAINHKSHEGCFNNLKNSNKIKTVKSILKKIPDKTYWDSVFKNFKRAVEEDQFWQSQQKKTIAFFFTKQKSTGLFQHEVFKDRNFNVSSSGFNSAESAWQYGAEYLDELREDYNRLENED